MSLKEWLSDPALGNIPTMLLVAEYGVHWANMLGGERRNENRDKQYIDYEYGLYWPLVSMKLSGDDGGGSGGGGVGGWW